MEKNLPEDAEIEDAYAKAFEVPATDEAEASDSLSVEPKPRSSGAHAPLGDRAAIVHAQMEFSGPLPHPQTLRQYDEVLPGAAERILRMAEKQQDHRIGIDQSGVRRANWGLGAGFSLSVLGLGLTALLVMHGHDIAGSVLGSGTFLSLVGTFVYGSKVRSQENIEKVRLLTGHDDANE